jgi:hypothetical protein
MGRQQGGEDIHDFEQKDGIKYIVQYVKYENSH